MVSARLLVEGGGDSKALRIECRRGFHDFLLKAGLKDRMPRIVACGGRGKAYDDFCSYHASARNGQVVLLLVDSETPVSSTSPWKHLLDREGDAWQRPSGASDEQCHLMVQCMEAWFLADRDSLRAFFWQGMIESALPGNPNIESISKQDVLTSLERATRNCKVKATYGKGEHSFKVLARIDPAKVSQASPWARRFLDTLSRVTNS
jgi:hypothetical protein